MIREVRVTIEVLSADDGETVCSEVVLVDASNEELEPGGLGEIESALDALLSRFAEDEVAA